MIGDTIAAAATPIGESAIGVLRISGPQTIPLLKKIFLPAGKETALSRRGQFLGKIQNPVSGSMLDEALVSIFPSPYSYTGEDCAEISCHGNPFILKEVLSLIFSLGARLAQPGEFTQRAYLNGKMDLTQAEAVNDLIRSHTLLSAESALSQMSGCFAAEVGKINSDILDLLALLEAAIDHSDMDEEFISESELIGRLDGIQSSIKSLLSTAVPGKMLRNGMKIAIAGAPNTGKSSLMNALLREDRVIVSDIPGTTRDMVEDELSIKGIPARLFDTAGVRQTDDFLEQKGIERTMRAVKEADLRIILLDSSREIQGEDIEVVKSVRGLKNIYVLNKNDLPSVTGKEELQKRFGIEGIEMSALTSGNLRALENQIVSFYDSFGFDPRSHAAVTNARQEALLREAEKRIALAKKAVETGTPEEIIAAEVRKARASVEEITGKTSDEAILDRIFSQFCIGK